MKKRPLYTQLLDPQERMDAHLTGAMLKSAEARVPMEKCADLAGLADAGTKTILAISLLTGVPLGIAAHLVGSSINKRKLKEREAMDKIDFYRDAGDAVESELAQSGLQL